MVLTRRVAVHALLYLIMSLLSVAVIFYSLGAPFVAALEVIIYAGAIMVLFLFVMMLLNLSPEATAREQAWLAVEAWAGPAVLAAILIGELVYAFASGTTQVIAAQMVISKQVGLTLFGPYLLGVELASILLLAGLVGAYHLGKRDEPGVERAAQIPTGRPTGVD
jgi:NADH-quinone oxidoreductase subunit J